MKLCSATARRLVIDCAALVALQIALLHVLARTNLLEKLMAGQFNRWEFGVIVGFVALRFAVYFLVPAFLAGLVTWKILGRFGRGRWR